MIFYIMGKSASGKDSIYQNILKDLPLKTTIPYTTRPMRSNETDGVEYFFTDISTFHELEAAGKVIESRCYQTVQGPWIYYTVDDGISEDENYLMIGTLESFCKVKAFYGEDVVVPIYIYVDDGIRLERAIKREQKETTPKYNEVCRRFLADEQDFSEDNLQKAGIQHRFQNLDMEVCLQKIKTFIKGELKYGRI